jgi:hypothetical protein
LAPGTRAATLCAVQRREPPVRFISQNRIAFWRPIARVCLLATVMAVNVVQAQDQTFGGHLKYQYTRTDYRADDLGAVAGDDPAWDHSLELRLKAERAGGAWEGAVHYELLAIAGDTVEARRRLADLGLLASGTASGLPDDRTRLFDLTAELSDRERSAAVHRLDRLYAGYRREGLSLRFGRQVVSWGNGLVFHPLDFVNPFSPIAIDKDYKTGDDMLYGQWVVGDGAETANATSFGDVQVIVVPRRDAETREVESEESTYAAKWRLRLNGFDLDLLAARHFDENLAGVGVVRSVGGAVWRFDAMYADLAHDDEALSFVTNLDYSWTWFDRNVYGYAEYFRSGVGESDPSDYVTPDPALAARIARGELFTLARDYLAAGLQVELTPLFNVYASLMRNLNDASHFLQIRGVYDWQQNLQLMGGFNLPGGERGDEFGGIPAGTPGTYLAPGRSAYVRAAYYF